MSSIHGSGSSYLHQEVLPLAIERDRERYGVATRVGVMFESRDIIREDIDGYLELISSRTPSDKASVADAEAASRHLSMAREAMDALLTIAYKRAGHGEFTPADVINGVCVLDEWTENQG